MTDCEIAATCPFLNGELQDSPELAARLKEEYCQGKYGWCGRYMLYKAILRGYKSLETEAQRTDSFKVLSKMSDKRKRKSSTINIKG